MKLRIRIEGDTGDSWAAVKHASAMLGSEWPGWQFVRGNANPKEKVIDLIFQPERSET